MRLLSCPKSDDLFEYVSIPEEMGRARRMGMKIHAMSCDSCDSKISGLRQKWEQTFAPKVDVCSSLMNVYSRLQNDETLILKGWKIGGEARPRARATTSVPLLSSWAFRGTAAAAFATIFGIVIWSQLGADRTERNFSDASATLPYARFRTEDPNRVKVQYVQPELLHSVEFETTNATGNR